jgi:hypothetical protein
VLVILNGDEPLLIQRLPFPSWRILAKRDQEWAILPQIDTLVREKEGLLAW